MVGVIKFITKTFIILLVTTQERRNQIDFLFHRSRGGTYILQDGLQLSSNIPYWCDAINRVATSKLFVILSFVLISFFGTLDCKAENTPLAEIEIREMSGLHRDLEYVICSLQLPFNYIENSDLNIVAIDSIDDEQIHCQIFNQRTYQKQNIVLFEVIFPVSLEANEKKKYTLRRSSHHEAKLTDLSYQGSGLELIIENEFYRADLTRSEKSEAKSHNSGQLSELSVKIGFNTRLIRTENRIHWAPNFQKVEYDQYETIAGWEHPKIYTLDTGPYLVHTMRSDLAPKHPEITLSANYYFYAGLPFFKFHSSMETTEDLRLFLLRNDEMTMDSLFTHVAFQRPDGEIEDLAFPERYKRLDEFPIENNAPWLCFYNAIKGYAFGSIRLKYDLTNEKGFNSPIYLPHTKISDGAGGGKYWNRRLINEFPVFVPKGSRYSEENAYIVFRIGEKNKFEDIEKWSQLLKNPLRVSIARP